MQVLGSSARQVERRSGVTNAQLFVLQILARDGDQKVGELAARALSRPNAVSSVVARLERSGLVRRTRGATDARQVLVSLTARGRAVAARGPAPPTARLIAALELLGEDHARAITRALTPLTRALGTTSSPHMLFEDGAAPPRPPDARASPPPNRPASRS